MNRLLLARILSYIPLTQIQIWQRQDETIFTPDLLLAMLNKYHISPAVVEGRYLAPVRQELLAPLLTPFDYYVFLALLAGDIGYNCQFYVDPIYCLVAAVRNNNLELVQYYLGQIPKIVESRELSILLPNMTDYHVLLKLATEHASDDIIYFILAQAVTIDFTIDEATLEYIRANKNDYFALRRLNLTQKREVYEKIINIKARRVVDVATYGLSLGEFGPNQIDPAILTSEIYDPEIFPGEHISDLLDDLNPYLSFRQLPYVQKMIDFVSAHWAPSENRDRYLGYCKLLLNQPVDMEIFLYEDNSAGKMMIEPNIVVLLATIMSPYLSTFKEYISNCGINPMVSEVLYGTMLEPNHPAVKNIYLTDGMIRGDTANLLSGTYPNTISIAYYYNNPRAILDAAMALRLKPYVKDIDKLLHPITMMQYITMKKFGLNPVLTPAEEQKLQYQKSLTDKRLKLFNLIKNSP